MDRAKVVFGHLNGSGRAVNARETAAVVSPVFSQSDDDVVICAALRTPLCKAGRGNLKDTLPDDLLAAVIRAVINEVGIDSTLIEDICIGNVGQPGAGGLMARMAQFFAGIPETVPLRVVNRFCSSGLQACASIAASIRAGDIDIGIGGGVESMTLNPMHRPPHGFELNPKAADCQKAMDCLVPMGITSENVAERFGVSREKQDQMAAESHRKAAAARANGWFKDEIVPIKTVLKDKEGNEKPLVVRLKAKSNTLADPRGAEIGKVSEDDGIRPGTTRETLAKLKPVFKDDGTTTAGNASQMTDGAAAVLLARRSAAKRYGLPILGVFRAFSVVGVPPDIMGVGPAYAIPAVLKKANLNVSNIDIFEINEAFASQAAYSVEKVGIPMEKVNPKGGAIALGHPLGCTGARQIATLLHELKRRGKPGLGVVSMCIGTGMGAAGLIEYPGK